MNSQPDTHKPAQAGSPHTPGQPASAGLAYQTLDSSSGASRFALVNGRIALPDAIIEGQAVVIEGGHDPGHGQRGRLGRRDRPGGCRRPADHARPDRHPHPRRARPHVQRAGCGGLGDHPPRECPARRHLAGRHLRAGADRQLDRCLEFCRRWMAPTPPSPVATREGSGARACSARTSKALTSARRSRARSTRPACARPATDRSMPCWRMRTSCASSSSPPNSPERSI